MRASRPASGLNGAQSGPRTQKQCKRSPQEFSERIPKPSPRRAAQVQLCKPENNPAAAAESGASCAQTTRAQTRPKSRAASSSVFSQGRGALRFIRRDFQERLNAAHSAGFSLERDESRANAAMIAIAAQVLTGRTARIRPRRATRNRRWPRPASPAARARRQATRSGTRAP